jgi:hypothetical protein
MLCNGNVPDANSPINFKNDYGHETVKFWQIGYRLFHGNFSALCPGFATLDRFGMEHWREVFLIRSVEI